MDSVWVDTPIADIDIVQNLRQMIDSTNIETRFERTDLFLTYLLDREEDLKKRHPEHSSSPLGKFYFVNSIISGFEKEKQYVINSFWRKKGV